MVFYVILFSALAVLLVVAGLTMQSRNRQQLHGDRTGGAGPSDDARRQRKAKRAQSRNARRRRG